MALEETLELDAGPALNTVDAIGSALSQVATAFRVELAQALEVLDQPIVTDVDADTSEAQTDIDALGDGTSVVVPIDGEPDDALSDLAEVQAAAEAIPGVDVTVTADGAEAAAAGLDQAGDAAAEAGADAADADSQFSIFGATLGQVAAAAAALGAVSFFGSALDGLKDASLSLELSSQLIETTGGAANVTAGEIRNLTVDLEKLSGIDADVVQAGANLLLTFKQVRNELGEGNDVYDRAVVAATDLSVVLQTDVRSAALQLGKALNDPVLGVTALSRAGVQFTEEQREQIRVLVENNDTLAAQKIILEELEGQVAGSAEALGRSLPGQIEILKRSFEDFSEGLVGEFLPLIDELLQVGSQEFFPALTDLVAELAPALTGTLSALSPLIGDVADGFVDIASEAGPALVSIADLLGQVLTSVSPLIPVVTGFVGLFADGLGFIAEGVSALLNLLGPVVPAIAAIAAALLLLNANPIFAVVTAVGLLANAFGAASDAGSDYTAVAVGFNEANLTSAATADELADAVDRTGDAFRTFLADSSTFAQAGLSDELAAVGLTAAEVGDLFARGDDGLKDFLATAADTGALQVGRDGIALYGDQVRELDGNIIDLINSGEIYLDDVGDNLLRAYQDQALELETVAETTLLTAQAEGFLTEEIVRQAEELAAQNDGWVTNQEVLAIATELQAEADAATAATTASIEAQTSVVGDQAAGILGLIDQLAAGTIATKDYGVVAQALGVDLAVVEQVAGAVDDAIGEFVESAVTKLPTAASALDGLEETYDPSQLIANLEETTLQILTFTANLAAIAEVSPEVAGFLAQQGPEAAAALASALAVEGPAAIQSIEDVEQALEDQGVAVKLFREIAENEFPPALAEVEGFAENASEALGTGLDFGGVSEAQISAAADTLGNAVLWADAEEAAADQGAAVGEDFGAGIADGIGNSTPAIEAAAAQAVADAEAAARAEADSNSPSKLFAEVGADLIAGLAEGLAASADLTVGVDAIPVTAATGAPDTAGGGGLVIEAGAIVVQVPDGTIDPTGFGNEVGSRIVERLVAADLGSR